MELEQFKSQLADLVVPTAGQSMYSVAAAVRSTAPNPDSEADKARARDKGKDKDKDKSKAAGASPFLRSAGVTAASDDATAAATPVGNSDDSCRGDGRFSGLACVVDPFALLTATELAALPADRTVPILPPASESGGDTGSTGTCATTAGGVAQQQARDGAPAISPTASTTTSVGGTGGGGCGPQPISGVGIGLSPAAAAALVVLKALPIDVLLLRWVNLQLFKDVPVDGAGATVPRVLPSVRGVAG